MIVLLVALALAAPVAGAQSYGTLDDGTVSDSTPAPGQAVSIVIGGFMPNSDVDLVINSDPVFLGTFRTDSDGVLRASVTIPAGLAAGAHTIVATGVNASNQPVSGSITVTVAAAPTSGGSSLPTTGADIAAALTVGLALVAAGTASVIAGRRHRSEPTR